jgi:hypothetical protein
MPNGFHMKAASVVVTMDGTQAYESMSIAAKGRGMRRLCVYDDSVLHLERRLDEIQPTL